MKKISLQRLLISAVFPLLAALCNGQQVFLSLGSTTIASNNSEILITDIGEDAAGGLPSLMCHTDLPGCCRSADGMAAGEWYYPDGSLIPSPADAGLSDPAFYRTRNVQVVRLNRRESSSPMSPTGSYCCVIPTTGGESTFCAFLVVCPSLNLTNGMISYSDPTRGVGSVATHTCDSGYSLTTAENTRHCGVDGQWFESVLTCADLMVLTLPEALVSSSGNVAEGSVIQIYCTVENDTTVTFTWTFNGSLLLSDPPHIRIREDNLPGRSSSLITNDSTSVLTVDNFRDTDNGVYQCTATDGSGNTGNGAAVTLTAVSATHNMTLQLIAQPSDTEVPAFNNPDLSLLNDNRTGIRIGGHFPASLLTCTAGHQGDGVMNYSPPSVVWVRDGQVVVSDSRITITITSMANGQVTTTLDLPNFQETDAGVYQCIFTDDSGNGEVITTIPHRADTGNTLRLERVSPEVIILRPPEKLVIELRASGNYEILRWYKGVGNDIPMQRMLPQEFPNFFEMFVRDNTTADDVGLYIVRSEIKTQTQNVIPIGGIDFAVIAPDDANTTSLSPNLVIIPDGGSANISCRSEGAPVPTITWELNNHPAGFEQTDKQTPFVATLTGSVENRMVDLTPGNTVSALHIVSAMYPDHDGVYTCIGTNAGDPSVASSSADVTVQIQVAPSNPVITFDPSNVPSLGDNVTLNCSALGGPDNVFQWQKDGMDLPGENQSTFELTSVNARNGGVYICVVSNVAGNASSNATLYIAPYFVTDPVDTSAEAGMNQTLTCEAEAFPEPTYQWVRVVGEEFGANVTGMNSNILMFTPVQFGDEGDYLCTATSNGMSQNSSIATLSVAPGDLVIGFMPSNVPSLRDNVTVNCSALGGPDNVFQWQKDGMDLSGENQSTLELTSVNAIDGGVYTCVVSNAAGNNSGNATLYIQPYITIDPQPQLLTTNDSTVTFTCEALAFPTPSYRWERTGNSAFNILNQNLTNDSVVFGDEGNYTCVAVIAVDMVNYTAVSEPGLLVVSPEGSVAASPNISNSMQEENRTFTCTAQGGPGNMFSWTRLHDSVTVGNMSSLTVSIQSAEDGGMYRCVVSNPAGNDSATVTLNVGPVIETPPMSANATLTETAPLICTVSGFPVPNITWLHNGTENEEDGSRTTISDMVGDRSVTSTLTINMAMVNDSGQYICNATSSPYDVVSSDPATLLVQQTPERPQNVTAVEVTTTSVVLEWVEPHDNNAPILGYRVSYITPLFLGGSEMTVNSSVEMVNITGLHPGTSYNFTVIAFNDLGDSSPSDPLMVTTVETAPTSPPENVSADVVSSTKIIVYWEQVMEVNRHGEITEYEVVYDPLMTFDGMLSVMTTNTSNLSIILTGLEEYVEYNISVRAYTNVGPGPYSVEIIRRTEEDVPASPPQDVSATVLSSTIIQVTWSEVPEIDQNGVITGYEVTCDPLMTFDGMLSVMTRNTSNLSIILTDLEEYVEYNISVRAYTNVGPGPYSIEITEMTNEDAPASPPQDVNVTVLSSTMIQMTWSEVPEIDQNGVITEYEVMYEPLMTFDGMLSVMTTNTSNLSIIVTDLEEYVEYNILVRTYTSVGPGPYSVEIISRTEEDAPASPPQDVNATVLSSTKIQVTWSEVPEVDQNGVITEYEVMYDPLMTFEGILSVMTRNTPNLSIILTGLEEYVEYNISVRAYTNVGPGPYSIEITEMTNEDAPASPPQNLNVTVLSSTVIQVTWSEVPDQNGVITEYEVMYEPLMTFDGMLSVMTMDTSNLSIILTDLEEYVEYNISVRAYTSVGPGPYSVGIIRRTEEDAPASPPQDVNATVLSSTMIHVTWSEVPEIDQNGVITEYEVMYEPLMTFDGMLSVMTTNTSNLSVILTCLEEYVEYNISVRAYTNVGPGPYSVGIIRRTEEDAPASPPQDVNATVLSPTVIQVTWSEVPEIDQNGVITEYEVMYESVDEPSATNGSERVGSETLCVNITQLEEFLTYNISVRVYTSVGPGPYSTPEQTVMTFPDNAPDMINHTLIETTIISLVAVRIVFEPPNADNDSVITQYQYQLCQNTCENRDSYTSADQVILAPGSDDVATERLSFVVVGLVPYSDYILRITAVNQQGVSGTVPVSDSGAYRFSAATLEQAAAVNGVMDHQLQTQLVFTWELPPLATGPGAIQPNIFVVTWRMFEADVSTNNIESAPYNDIFPRQGILLSNLTADVQYIVYVVTIYTEPNIESTALEIFGTTLSVEEEPEPAVDTGPVAVTITPDTLNIQWPAPNVNFLTTYVVSYTTQSTFTTVRKKRQLAPTVERVPVGTNTLTINGPEPAARYTFNVDGEVLPPGATQPAVIPITPEQVIISSDHRPNAPDITSVRESANGDPFHSLDITWNLPSMPGGILLNCTIVIGSRSIILSSEGGMAPTSYTIQNLSPGHVHSFDLFCSNSFDGLSATGSGRTAIGVAIPTLSTINVENNLITMQLTASDTFGSLNSYQIIVSTLPHTGDTRDQTFQAYPGQGSGYVTYTGTIPPGSLYVTDVVIGSGEVSTTNGLSFTNQPLQPGEYYVFARVFGQIMSLFNDSVVLGSISTLPELCEAGPDPIWGIEWPSTLRSSTSVQSCPEQLSTGSVVGQAIRYCDNEGMWLDPDVSNCQDMEFLSIIDETSNKTVAEIAEQAVNLTTQLAIITEPDEGSLLPSSLNTTNQVLSQIIDALEVQAENTTTDITASELIVDVLNNVLEVNNSQGWAGLQSSDADAGSQVLLDNAERLAIVLARSQNSSEPVRVSRSNIVISSAQYDTSNNVSSDDLRFPDEEDVMKNSTSAAVLPAVIQIPPSLLQERLSQQNDSTAIPVVFILFQTLGSFLSSSTSGLGENTRGASVVISSQVGERGTTQSSQALIESPLQLNFTFDIVNNTETYHCVFWDFSPPGSWSKEGVSTGRNTSDGQRTTVQCSSTHLTSFAVLVDVADGLKNISEAEETALEIVSYIGCAISVVSLFITVVFFLAHGKQLFVQVHYFVHLNLSLSLLLGYVVFMVGIETAVDNKAGCAFVTALLHYLFLAAFCWMLCEGVMLYLMLVDVFSRLAKKWWFFMVLGYLLPVPFVVVTVAVRWQYFGVTDSAQSKFCWLTARDGTIFGFVAPMLAIVLINVVFLGFILRTLWKNKRSAAKRMNKEKGELLQVVRPILLGVVVLLPLLGLTWTFGLLTINSNTTVFAWLFTIFNSLQGVSILFFHVIRSEKVQNKIKSREWYKKHLHPSTLRKLQSSSTQGTQLRERSKVSTLEYSNTTKTTLSRDHKPQFQFDSQIKLDLTESVISQVVIDTNDPPGSVQFQPDFTDEPLGTTECDKTLMLQT